MAGGRLNPVAWTEGMFLRPQHLQQQDRFLDAQLHYHLSALNPFHWGVRELEIDEEALGDGRIVVNRLEAVLRGGSIVRYKDNVSIEPRKFDPSLERVEVFLALREPSATDPNTTAADDGEGPRARYLLRRAELPDVNRGGFESPVDLLFPNARLLLSGEEAERELCDSFKLCEIEATGDTNRPFAVSNEYIPPLLTIQASAALDDELSQILNQVAARVRAAAGQTKTLSVPALPQLWMRYTLARGAPLLRHLLSTGETHPFVIYTALVEIAGALGALRYDEAVTPPLYDHENLRLCFGGLVDFINEQLDRITPMNFQKVPLELDAQHQCYATRKLTTELISPHNSYYLAVRAPMESEALVDAVARQGKAASLGDIENLVKLALPGLRLEPLPGPPTEIETMAGFHYFRVDPHTKPERLWSRIRDEYSFALHLGKVQNAAVFLYVVVPQG